MVKVIGVKVDGNERVANCKLPEATRTADLTVGTAIICLKQGVEFFAKVDRSCMEMPERYMAAEMYQFIRLADEKDILQYSEKTKFEKEALLFASENAKRLSLDMKFLKSYLDQIDNKFLFYFESPERLDFRELVKCLAYRYRMRIELRQVGAREKAKLCGTLGACGQVACCVRHLETFPQVSIKMAKEQGISISSSKSQGTCGRLMCCLQYEQAWYEEALDKMPRLGYALNTIYGKGVVKSVNLQREIVQVQLESAKDSDPWQVVNMSEILGATKPQLKNVTKVACKCSAKDGKNKGPCCMTDHQAQESVYLSGKSYNVLDIYKDEA